MMTFSPNATVFVDLPELTKDTPPLLVARVLVDLIEGRIAREHVAGWASHHVCLDDPPDVDRRVWDAVERMSGADSPSTDREYLYGLADFEEWLRELNAE